MSLYTGFDEDSDEYPIVDLDSDEDSVLSSSEGEEIDEDIDISPPKKCEDDEDDFEQEMRQELDKKIEEIEEKNELNTKLPMNKKEPEELFYDPNADDNDQIWMDTVHKSSVTASLSSKSKSAANIPVKTKKSDAVLNCPGCMSVLTTDCQRHEKYESQYRSMFVSNCRISDDDQLKYEKLKRSDQDEESDIYSVVVCDVCSSRVGVIDSDQVYHFFDVLASY